MFFQMNTQTQNYLSEVSLNNNANSSLEDDINEVFQNTVDNLNFSQLGTNVVNNTESVAHAENVMSSMDVLKQQIKKAYALQFDAAMKRRVKEMEAPKIHGVFDLNSFQGWKRPHDEISDSEESPNKHHRH